MVMEVSQRKIIALVIVTAMVTLAGCADVTATVDINDAGEVDGLEYDIEIEEQTYNMLESEISNEGYDSVGEALASDMETDEEMVNEAIYEEEERDGAVGVIITATDFDAAEIEEDIEVTDEETVLVSIPPEESADDPSEMNAPEEDIGDIELVLNMPGEVIDTNLDEENIEDNTVTVDLDNHDDEIVVESETSNGIPGFGVGMALGAVLISVALLGLRQLRG